MSEKTPLSGLRPSSPSASFRVFRWQFRLGLIAKGVLFGAALGENSLERLGLYIPA
jgi:hypothetical protein